MESYTMIPQPEQESCAADIWRPVYQHYSVQPSTNEVNHNSYNFVFLDKFGSLVSRNNYQSSTSSFSSSLPYNNNNNNNFLNNAKSHVNYDYFANSKNDFLNNRAFDCTTTTTSTTISPFLLRFPSFLINSDWFTHLMKYQQLQASIRLKQESEMQINFMKLIRKKKKNNKASTYAFLTTNDFRINGLKNLVPWYRFKVDSKPYSQDIYGLHEEIKHFFSYISPTEEEIAIRECVIQRVSEIIKQTWPTADIEVFGSFRTGLFLPTSDIDMAVNVKDVEDKQSLRVLEHGLRRSGIATEILMLDRAVVPIIKFKDVETDVRVDVGLNLGGNKNTGLRSAELIQEFINEFPVLPYLVVVLKQFLLQRELNEVWKGGLSSYCLTLMCVRFLQDNSDGKLIDDNLGKLLIEFFEFYSRQFNHQSLCIRVKDGGSFIPKTGNFTDRWGTSAAYLAVEDPFNSENDIARRSYRFLEVKNHFEAAYQALSHSTLPFHPSHILFPNVSLLSRIISISSEVQEYRQWIQNNFFHGRKKYGQQCRFHKENKDQAIVRVSPPYSESIPQAIDINQPIKSIGKPSDIVIHEEKNQDILINKCSTIRPRVNSQHGGHNRQYKRVPVGKNSNTEPETLGRLHHVSHWLQSSTTANATITPTTNGTHTVEESSLPIPPIQSA